VENLERNKIMGKVLLKHHHIAHLCSFLDQRGGTSLDQCGCKAFKLYNVVRVEFCLGIHYFEWLQDFVKILLNYCDEPKKNLRIKQIYQVFLHVSLSFLCICLTYLSIITLLKRGKGMDQTHHAYQVEYIEGKKNNDKGILKYHHNAHCHSRCD
jgi:hypothetical protein